MATSIDLQIRGLFPGNFAKVIETTIDNVDKSLENLANETVDHMRSVIKIKTYRSGSTGNLTKSIQSYKIQDGYGVGDTSYMTETAPYWAIINYGGFVSIATSGKVLYGNFEGSAPDASKSGSNPGAGTQRFTKGAIPLYGMVPSFPINPKNYIEDTVSWLYSYISGYDLTSTKSSILP